MKKEPKKNKSKILIKLLIYVLVLCGIYGYLLYENNKIQKQQEEYNKRFNFVVDFDYVKTSLLNNDFDYLYIILDDDSIISYSGNRMDNKYTGTVKVNNNITSYNDLTILNKKYPFLSIEKILSYFNGDYTKTNRTFLYEKDNLYVKIRVSIDNVVGIEIDDGDIIYQLEITNIKGFEVKGSD